MQYSSRAKVWTCSAIALLSGFALLGCAFEPRSRLPAPNPALPSPTIHQSSIAESAAPTPQPVRVGPSRSAEELWALLRQAAGLVVLLGHARAPGTGDPPAFRLDDCSTQRNLNAEGQRQSRQLGEAFRQRQIPVARVRI